MNAIEQKKELHDIIDQVDSSLVTEFYIFTKTFLKMKEQEKMIQESETDIIEGKIYSLNEVESIIRSWKE